MELWWPNLNKNVSDNPGTVHSWLNDHVYVWEGLTLEGD